MVWGYLLAACICKPQERFILFSSEFFRGYKLSAFFLSAVYSSSLIKPSSNNCLYSFNWSFVELTFGVALISFASSFTSSFTSFFTSSFTSFFPIEVISGFDIVLIFGSIFFSIFIGFFSSICSLKSGNGVPHSPQKLSPFSLRAPQLGQMIEGFDMFFIFDAVSINSEPRSDAFY